MCQDGDDIHQFIEREFVVVHHSTPAVDRIGTGGWPGVTQAHLRGSIRVRTRTSDPTTTPAVG